MYMVKGGKEIMDSIGCFTTRRVTKRELIDAINKAYPDDVKCGKNYSIAVCLETSVHYDDEPKQIIQFGKNLKF